MSVLGILIVVELRAIPMASAIPNVPRGLTRPVIGMMRTMTTTTRTETRDGKFNAARDDDRESLTALGRSSGAAEAKARRLGGQRVCLREDETLLLGMTSFKLLVDEWARDHKGQPFVEPPPELAQACFLEGFLPAFVDGMRRTGS